VSQGVAVHLNPYYFYSLVLFFTSLNTYSAGFSRGNEFHSFPAEGVLQVTCATTTYGQFVTKGFYCQGDQLDTEGMDRFVGPIADADQVTLTAEHENGTSNSESNTYEGKSGLSKSFFNLWLWTTNRRPLLAQGKNVVTYQLKKSNQVITEGQFEVLVHSHEASKCKPGKLATSDFTYCLNSASLNICNSYLRQQNYCR
jgi:hypothetical protein